jgi:3-hydroxyisobutyrate dehydrogenase-like beta-hydroxyacid dehydrogenase
VTDEVVVGVLHPGEMGAAVGRQLRERGTTVLWSSAGRSPETAGRAAAAGLADAGDMAELARRSEVVLSICPPHAAVGTARSFVASASGTDDGAAGFAGVFVDANAVSPATAREIAAIIAENGGRFVDGGIIGPPPPGGGTRLYLSADSPDSAEHVAGLFARTDVDARVIAGGAGGAGGAGAASAVKMAYAAWTKGTAALVLAVRALARAEEVEDALDSEWALSQPQLGGRLDAAARSAVTKGWRWVAEMEEISAAFTAVGIPGGFHQAAAEVFRRSPRLPPPDGEEAVDAVIGPLLAAESHPAG